MKELDRDNLEDYLLSIEKLFVLFGTNSCGACRIAKTQMQKLVDQNIAPAVTILFVNTKEYPVSKKMGEIKATPTLVSYYKGKKQGAVEGYVEKAVIQLLTELNNRENEILIN